MAGAMYRRIEHHPTRLWSITRRPQASGAHGDQELAVVPTGRWRLDLRRFRGPQRHRAHIHRAWLVKLIPLKNQPDRQTIGA
jgi:hypothetical protein